MSETPTPQADSAFGVRRSAFCNNPAKILCHGIFTDRSIFGPFFPAK